MDQNQTIENQANVDNDLQKAIDDITNTTNVDPVFSDPVAAPSSVPEGDTGELAESVGPFPEPQIITMPQPPEPQVAAIPQPPEPIAPLESMNIPEINNFINTPISAPTPAPAPMPSMPVEPVMEQPKVASSLSTTEIKKAALRDLVPILDKINVDPTQRFNIYRDIFTELKDYTVLEPAYQAARDIPNEAERAEALLYLVESIDKM